MFEIGKLINCLQQIIDIHGYMYSFLDTVNISSHINKTDIMED